MESIVARGGNWDGRYFTESESDLRFVRLTTDQTVAGIKAFSSFPLSPSVAPSSNYQFANKKYVDDEIAGVSFTESDPVFTTWLSTTPPLYSETDPIFSQWLIDTPPLYGETDPVYSASSWFTTTNNASNWDAAYGWGDHSVGGYLKADGTVPLTDAWATGDYDIDFYRLDRTTAETLITSGGGIDTSETLDNYMEAVKFTLPTDCNLGKIRVYLKRTGTITNNATISGYIYSDSGGSGPLSPLKASQNNYAAEYFATDYDSKYFYFNYSIAAGTYWFVLLRPTAPTGGTIEVYRAGTGTGSHAYSSGITWTLENNKTIRYFVYSGVSSPTSSILIDNWYGSTSDDKEAIRVVARTGTAGYFEGCSGYALKTMGRIIADDCSASFSNYRNDENNPVVAISSRYGMGLAVERNLSYSSTSLPLATFTSGLADTQNVLNLRQQGTGKALAIYGTSASTVLASVDGSGNIVGNTVTSEVAAGTAPLVVASNTLVNNLNADLLDGQHASDFAPSSITQYTDEMAQDAIGGILTDTDEIDFTYDDDTPKITATIKTNAVDNTMIDWGTEANQVSADDIPDGETNIIPTDTQETNWDEAYSWGDHSSSGYLKADGSVALTADWDSGDYKITSKYFESVETGVDQSTIPSFYGSQSPATLQSGGDTGTDESYNVKYEAVKFVADGNHNVRGLKVWLKRTGTITNPTAKIQGYIYTDNAGVPNTATYSSTTSVAYGSLTEAYVAHTFYTISNLTSGTTYWLVLKQSTAPTGGTVEIDSVNTGTATHAYSANGSSWTTENNKTIKFALLGRTYVGVWGASDSYYGVYGNSVSSVGVYGVSENYYGIRGYSEASAGGYFSSDYNVGCAAVSNYDSAFIGYTQSGRGAYLLRLTSAGSYPLLDLYQGVAGDTQPVINIAQYGTGDMVAFYDGAVKVGQIDDTGDITLPTFTSTATTGTAPLTVASTTLVTNLNADLLDGNEASAFALSGHTHTALTSAANSTTLTLTDDGTDQTLTGNTGKLNIDSAFGQTNIKDNVDISGNLAVGNNASIDPKTALFVDQTFPTGTGAEENYGQQLNVHQYAGAIHSLKALAATWEIAGTADADVAYGLYFEGYHSSSSKDALPDGRSIYSQYYNTDGTTDNAYGLFSGVAEIGGSIGTGYGGRFIVDGSTTAYGVHSEVSGAGTDGTAGRFVANSGSKTNNYGIYATASSASGANKSGWFTGSYVHVGDGGTATNTGDGWAFAESGFETDGIFRSDVATGTAPLTIASTTLVSNLNADLLDGHEWSEVPTQYTDELAQDAVGGILTDTDEIDFTYTDGTPSITATIKADAVDETMVDWGTQANQISLDDVPDGTSYERVAADQLSSGIYKNATTSQKGISSFATADFTVTTGAVSTKKVISTTPIAFMPDSKNTDFRPYNIARLYDPVNSVGREMKRGGSIVGIDFCYNCSATGGAGRQVVVKTQIGDKGSGTASDKLTATVECTTTGNKSGGATAAIGTHTFTAGQMFYVDVDLQGATLPTIDNLECFFDIVYNAE